MFFPRMQFLRQLEILCPFNNVFVMLELHAFFLGNPVFGFGVLLFIASSRARGGLTSGVTVSRRDKLPNLGVVAV
jgi:hypothetical protein